MDDWIAKYGDENKVDAIARLIAMHRIVGVSVREISARDKKLQVATLAISVVTSGALWVYVSGALPKTAAIVGAALSTAVTGITLYQLSLGPTRNLEQANDLYQEFGRSLANVREYPDQFSWHQFKHLESAYTKLCLEEPNVDQIQSARISGML